MLGRVRTVAAAISLVAISACGQAHKAGLEPQAVSPSGSLTVRERVVPDYKAVAAIITNRDAGDARARISGRLSQLLVREGDSVKKNQLVAVITDDRIASEAQAAAAGQVAAQAANDQAQRDLARAEKLFASQAIAQTAIENARTQAQAAAASLRAAKAQADAARALEQQGEVRSPAEGKVLHATIPQGSNVMAGDLIVAISTGAQVLRVELPESEGKSLSAGSEIALAFEQGGSLSKSARIRQIYPAVVNGRITADLDAPGLDTAFIGARVRVLVPVGQRRAIVVPASYIDTRYGADYVRLSRANAAIDVPIQRGGALPAPDMPDGVEVLSGLRDGDVIVPAGGAQ